MNKVTKPKSLSTKSGVNSKLTNLYLIAYNLISALGWCYLFLLTINTILSWSNFEHDAYAASRLYSNTSIVLEILIATAGLEFFHACARIVPSPPVVVLIQCSIRFAVVWGVIDNFRVCQESFGLLMVVVCWSLSEITRYLYYTLNLTVKREVYLLKWCRYNFFLVLYPVGAAGEVVCIALAAFYIRPATVRAQYSLSLPNRLNFSFDLFYFFLVWMALYLPVFPFMYFHMVRQRQKYLYTNKQKLN
jgi:very-long-chain (3R)-3-hydroxyacyl-CoA dehydratase